MKIQDQPSFSYLWKFSETCLNIPSKETGPVPGGLLDVWKQNIPFLDVLLQYFYQVIAKAVNFQFVPEE